ncbi:MAG: hypothetical protein NC483_04455 [Ruminococcus sp.]|nr:hypothetical protein [Ruminococcus sp.]
MLHIKKLENNEESHKLNFKFQTTLNPNWKEFYIASSIITGHQPLSQGNISDYEFFKLINSKKQASDEFPSTEYYLMENSEPVTAIYIIMRTPNIADITITTIPEKRNQGFAKTAITMIEKILFQNPNIFFTTITDITEIKISSRLAISLGYEYDEDTNTFVKLNPNFTIEEIEKQAALMRIKP